MNMGVKLDVELRTMGEETFAIIRFPERMKVLSRAGWKKAIVTLAPGEKIPGMEGL